MKRFWLEIRSSTARRRYHRTEILLLSEVDGRGLDWSRAACPGAAFSLESRPPEGARFQGPLPPFANTSREIANAAKSAKDYLYRNRSLILKYEPAPDLCQQPDESIEAFHARVQLESRERGDKEIDAFVKKQESAIERLEERLYRKEMDVTEKEATLRGRQQERVDPAE